MLIHVSLTKENPVKIGAATARMYEQQQKKTDRLYICSGVKNTH